MKPNLFDLRFLIGMFFLIVGVIVVFASFGTSSVSNGNQINLYSGIVFLVFAGLMLLSYRSSQKGT
jgi:uncharacterized membrane protein HdeD (DUF308 family)